MAAARAGCGPGRLERHHVGDTVRTWDGKPLRAGEIVILHWVPGLGGQFAALLAQISAQHLTRRR